MSKEIGYYSITITNDKEALECKVPSGSNEPDYLLNKAIKAHHIKKNVGKWRIKDLHLIKILGGSVEKPRPILNDTQDGIDTE